MPSFKIREFKADNPAEIESVKTICRDFDKFKEYEKMLSDDYFYKYVMEYEGKLIAILIFSRHSYGLFGDLMWVDQDYRHKGVGMFFLRFFESFAYKNGFNEILCVAFHEDDKLHNLFTRFGASQVGRYKSADDDSEWILYRKKIYQNDD